MGQDDIFHNIFQEMTIQIMCLRNVFQINTMGHVVRPLPKLAIWCMLTVRFRSNVEAPPFAPRAQACNFWCLLTVWFRSIF